MSGRLEETNADYRGRSGDRSGNGYRDVKSGAQSSQPIINTKAFESLRQDLSSHSETFVLDVRDRERHVRGGTCGTRHLV